MNVDQGTIIPIPLDVDKAAKSDGIGAIRELAEVKKQYRNYRDTIRQMLDVGELVYVGDNKEPS